MEDEEVNVEKKLEKVGKSLLGYTYGVKINGVRIYKRSNSHYTLIKQLGRRGKVKAGFEISSSYGPIRELLSDPDGYIVKDVDDSGVVKSLEKDLGVESFCASRIGEESEFILAMSLPNNMSSSKKDEISSVLYTLSNTINSRLSKDKLEDILEEAIILQKSVLPKNTPVFEGYDLDFLVKESDLVGGDYINFFKLNDVLGIAIADASGHGLLAAVQAMRVHDNLETFYNLGKADDLVGVMSSINKRLYADKSTWRFVTKFYGLLSKEGDLFYSNAGHESPLIFRSNGGVDSLKEGGIPLGVREDAKYKTGYAKLDQGDALLLYTDGVTEVFNEAGEEFGIEGLQRIMSSLMNKSASDAVKSIYDVVFNYDAGLALKDDKTLALVKKL